MNVMNEASHLTLPSLASFLMNNLRINQSHTRSHNTASLSELVSLGPLCNCVPTHTHILVGILQLLLLCAACSCFPVSKLQLCLEERFGIFGQNVVFFLCSRYRTLPSWPLLCLVASSEAISKVPKQFRVSDIFVLISRFFSADRYNCHFNLNFDSAAEFLKCWKAILRVFLKNSKVDL